MDFVTHKVGVVAENGFLLRTWEHIAKQMDVPEWRVKDCKAFAMARGWITSKQPKDLSENGEWVCLASVKRVTDKYFEDLGIVTAMQEAKAASITKVVEKSKATGLPVAFYLTPISLLKEIKKTLTTSWNAYFDDYHNRKNCADIPY
ncbi:hypothetical protein M2H03_14360 [Vibrio vulnificus]|nr:hypothetical protein [Vibrio vulnificus]